MIGRPSVEPVPLAAAALRLRGQPGRPRKAGSAEAREASAPPSSPPPERGPATDVPGTCPNPVVTALLPRLLDLPTTAAYLGLSEWTVRDLEAAGVLPRIRVPLPHGGELRKLLFDREDLDRLIAAWKDGPVG